MKLIQLRYFVEVVKTNSITKAAKKLYVSQPAVSKAINNLEEEFKVPLFIRYNNQLVLTDEGHHLYKLAVSLLKNADDLIAEMGGLNSSAKILKIGIPPMLGSFMISKIIKEYSSTRPDVEIQVVELGGAANRKALINQDIELCLTLVPQNEAVEPELEYHVIEETSLLFGVSASSSLSKKTAISFEEIGNYPLILMKEDTLQSSLVMEKFQEKGIVPNIKIRTNQIYTIRELLLNNNLGAFIFAQILEKEENIVGVPFKEEIKFNIILAHNKNVEPNDVSRDFIDFTIRKFENK